MHTYGILVVVFIVVDFIGLVAWCVVRSGRNRISYPVNNLPSDVETHQ